ncbi:NHS-like protein 3 isoform X2 [Oncorhynchus nerka]|uniref:NHS-like protein 3 isoform X2 n=1 Tax=Oncorhynchus nerka TaxID=8023 RepID=UPI0031B7FA3F
MGNSVHKNKKRVPESRNGPSSHLNPDPRSGSKPGPNPSPRSGSKPGPNPSPRSGNTKSFWHFGRVDKLKTAGPKCLDEQKELTVHYTASSHYQENVFIEGNRPQYLEDLHTEAREGLKILQQEEHNKGVDFQDDHSDADVSPNHRNGSQESGSTAGNPVTAVTSAGLAVSTRPVLTRQGSTFKPLNPVKRLDKRKNRRTTIMGIPQQVQRELALHSGSEYKVHSQLPNGSVGQGRDGQSGVVVIPTIDGETPLANYEGARVHLSDLEASREEQLLRHHLQSVYRDDQGFSHHRGLDSRLSSTQRPKSLAVPGTTSSCSSGVPRFLQEPQGPVMSISPQATYMSKIIPNAYLPASVDVIQIDRSTSRTRGNKGNGTARTVSKSCLASGSSDSPASSRRSGGEGCYEGGDSVSHGDSSSCDNGSKVTPHSVTSRSSWSHSQSSETIKSNSSAISSTKGSFGLANPQTVSLVGQETQPQQPGAGDQEKVSLQSSASWVSSTSRGTGTATAQGILSGSGGMSDVGGDSFRFSRCLSIMKTKLPPAPPRRTNSLHHEKMIKRRLVEIKDLSDSAGGKLEAAEDTSLVTIEISKELYKEITKSSVPVSKSSGFNSLDDTRSSAASSPLSPTQASHGGSGKLEGPVSSSSSPQKAPSEEGTFERTMSPSSGYSSQSGTPTLSPKGILPSVSPGKQKKYPVKPERSGSRASFSAASVSSSLTSLSSVTSELVNREASKNSFNPLQQASLPPAVMRIEDPETVTPVRFSSSMAIIELLNIPPPPKIKAPSPPPPETWAHNRHTFELLCGPCPNVNRLAQLQEQQELKEQAAMIEQKQEPQNKSSKESEGSNKKQATVEEVTLTKSESKYIVPRDKTEPMLEQAPEVSESTESQTKEQGSLAVIAEKVKVSVEIQDQKQEQSSSSSSSVAQVKDQEERLETQVSLTMIPKKEPPPVMKKSTHRKEAKVQLTADIQQKSPFDEVTVEVKVESPSESEKCSPQAEVVAKEVEVEVAAKEVEGRSATENTIEESPTKSTQTLAVEPPKVDRVSPPASPPPSHHPPPPPSKTPPYSVAPPPPEVEEECEEEIPIIQSCWPPPPPPEEPADSVFDEMDFPPPPPPFMTESLPDVVETCNTVADVQASIIALDGEEVKETVNVFTVATVNGETTDLSPISTQMEPKEDKPERVILNSNALIPTDETSFEESESTELQLIPSDDSAVVSPVQPNEKEAEVKPSAQKPITMQDTPQPTETSPESQEIPPLPEDVPPSHQEAPPPPPPMTTALVPPSSIPPPPPINVPLPPRVQFEDQMPSVLPNSAPRLAPINIPLPPPLPTENQPPVIFRRQPSLANRETRSKELLLRHKSVPIPKEDANIPLVTPSLLQMVRLRSVNVGEDYVKAHSDDNNSNSGKPPAQDQSSTQIQTQGSQNITPQKPIRRSLSLKSTPRPLKSSPVTLIAPSMSMQEAIRMKTAAMSSRDNLPTRFRMPSSTSIPSCSGGKSGMLSPMLPEGGEMLKTPTTTTASFIFSRSSKKVVIETPASSSSPEVQASLKQSLAAELKRFSEQSMASTVANGNVGRTGIPRRIPPPVAKKPAHTLEKPVCSTLRSNPSPRGTEANGETETAQPAGQQALTEDSK